MILSFQTAGNDGFINELWGTGKRQEAGIREKERGERLGQRDSIGSRDKNLGGTPRLRLKGSEIRMKGKAIGQMADDG